jgi:hypothetical protein
VRLRFIGVDPDTGGEGSPMVWVEEESADLVVQGEQAGDFLEAVIRSTVWVAGHARGIPAHQRLVRVPARLVPVLREACDAAEDARARPRGPY